MNKPTNILGDREVKQKELAGVANVTYDFGRAQGKEGESLQIQYGKSYDNAYSKLEKETTMQVTIENYIAIRDKDGEIYRINAENGEPLICEGQDEKKVQKVVNEFKKAIKEVGLKVFNEMLNETKYANIGYDNVIDEAQVKSAVNKYLQEKEDQEEAR